MEGENDFDDVKDGLDWLDPILDYWPGGELALSNCAWEAQQQRDFNTLESSRQLSPFEQANARQPLAQDQERSSDSSRKVRGQ